MSLDILRLKSILKIRAQDFSDDGLKTLTENIMVFRYNTVNSEISRPRANVSFGRNSLSTAIALSIASPSYI